MDGSIDRLIDWLDRRKVCCDLAPFDCYLVLRSITRCADRSERRNFTCWQQLRNNAHLRSQPQVHHNGSAVRRVRPHDPWVVSL